MARTKRHSRRNGKERKGTTLTECMRKSSKDNIEYDILLQDMKFDHDRLNEIVALSLKRSVRQEKKIRIAGDDYPAELVKSKFMKLNSEHIRFVLDCMQENTTKIRNIKQYLKAVLFNAPSTIDSYYTSLVAHDMASGALSEKAKIRRPGLLHLQRGRKPVNKKRRIYHMAQKTGALIFDETTLTATTFALTLPTITAACIAGSAWTYSQAANGSRPALSTGTTGILWVFAPRT